MQRFIQDYAKICEPLRRLIRKDVKWKWGQEQEHAFQKLKQAISTEPCLAYFQLGAETVVISDASPVGLGAILMQRQTDNELRPVAYASRSLTDTERRYSQMEREALGCVWSVDYFRNYLWGTKFKILTDHRPLIHMLNSRASTIVPPRIQRLLWKLQAYDYVLEYLPGKSNIADCFSRMPLLDDSEGESFADEYIHSIVELSTSQLDALTLNELKEASEKDPVIEKLRDVICDGHDWPKKGLPPELEPFYRFRQELSVFGHLVLRGSRVVVPACLRKRVLEIAHETHPGIVRTKSFLRMRFFWPNMDLEVENLVGNCSDCILNQPLIPDQPLHPSEL
ncbi:MAG: hypothetical protein MJA29_12015, partial [Candidatus Omnitrophica bacterium]|nr:hypothetical protein [Candidatus Omnitrophota bacterium]